MTARGRTEEARSRLRALHDAAVHRTRDLARSFDAIVEAASGVATDDEHDPEGHTIAWERQQLAALLADARVALVRIEDALQRLDEGTYGTCTRCGVDIGDDRLDALPATPTCLECAQAPVP